MGKTCLFSSSAIQSQFSKWWCCTILWSMTLRIGALTSPFQWYFNFCVWRQACTLLWILNWKVRQPNICSLNPNIPFCCIFHLLEDQPIKTNFRKPDWSCDHADPMSSQLYLALFGRSFLIGGYAIHQNWMLRSNNLPSQVSWARRMVVSRWAANNSGNRERTETKVVTFRVRLELELGLVLVVS